MSRKIFSLVAMVTVALSSGGCVTTDQSGGLTAQKKPLSGDKFQNTEAVFRAYMQSHPEIVVDLSNVSGEYCINTWSVGGGHMTHYAIEPSSTKEDIVDFVKAQSFVDAGVDVTQLPSLPDKLGQMRNGQWYYLPMGGMDPHHGRKTPVALVVRATDLR